MAIYFTLPRPEGQFLDSNGSVSREWLLFFSALLQSVGGVNAVVPGPSGISTADNAQQFEEYAVTSLEAVEALRAADELRNEVALSRASMSNLDSIEALRAVDDIRNEIASSRVSLQYLQTQIDDFSVQLSALQTYSDLRNRIESIEDRLL